MVKTSYATFIVLLSVACSQTKSVNKRCSESSCIEGSALSGANATFAPFKIPNAPDGPWTLRLEEGSVLDPKTGLRRVKISWNAYPNAKKYQLIVGLDKDCNSPIKNYDINGIFYDQVYSREMLIEHGISFFACLKATLPDQGVAVPENSPLSIGTDAIQKLSFRVLPPLSPMHTGPFKVNWSELSGAISYEITIMDSKGNIARSYKDIKGSGPSISYEISDLPQGRYLLRVFGFDNVGAKIKALTDKKDTPYEFIMAPKPEGTWSILKPVGSNLSARTDAAIAYTSKGILVWGGSTTQGIAQDGGIYDLSSNQWAPIATLNSPEPRISGSAWTGSQLVIWGGSDFDLNSYKTTKNLATGAAYDVAKDQWIPMATADAPSARQAHSMTPIGQSVFVWGGVNKISIEEKSAATLGDGGIYNTLTQTWTPVQSTTGISRAYHCSVWTGTHVIIWGGAQKNPGEDLTLIANGEMFDPATLQWKTISSQGQPAARYAHNCVWTGKKMLVWGGSVRFFSVANGAAYDPQSNTWSPIEDTNAPLATIGEAAYWSGRYLMTWGGREGETNLLQLGALYDPEINKWKFTTLEGAPSPRWGAQMVGQDSKVYFFGGDSIQRNANPPGKIYDDLVEFSIPQ